MQPETLVLEITAQQGNMGAAMLLLDHVSDDYTPRIVRILVPIYGKIEHHWKVVIMPNVGGGEEFGATHEDPAMAICRAYLAYTAALRPGDGDPAGEDRH